MRLLRKYKRTILVLVALAIVCGWLRNFQVARAILGILGILVIGYVGWLALMFGPAVLLGKAMARQDKLDEQARLERLRRERQRLAKPASPYATPPGSLDNLSPGAIHQHVLNADWRHNWDT